MRKNGKGTKRKGPERSQGASGHSREIALKLPRDYSTEIRRRASELGYKTVSDYVLALHRFRSQVEEPEGTYRPHPALESPAGLPPVRPRLAFETKLGRVYSGDSAKLMRSELEPQSVDLILTSPPFGLVRRKDYGNEDADRYVSWFEQFAEGFVRVLKPNGSLVIDIGGTWKPGLPTRSLYHFELLIMLCRKFKFHLAQEFYWWNPAKLPTPAEWVNIRRIRVKDAINCIWWLSLSPYPKASNRRVLQPYSESMRDLLKNGYKPKLRPSGHDISDKFQRDNAGAIPPNLIALANTESNGAYQRYCRAHGLKEHPARFPSGIPANFVKMLTDPGDVVFDPFAGSCVTGEVCERLGRRWICCELDEQYVRGAKGRFRDTQASIWATGAGPTRTKPYEIYPPNALITNDREAPLVPDGGRGRPKRPTSDGG